MDSRPQEKAKGQKPLVAQVWEEPRFCDCDWCKRRGGRNMHAVAFYNFLRRAGDRPTVKETGDKIIITVPPA